MAGLSQRSLAETVEVSASQINHYEKDKRNPTSQTLVRLAEALNITSDKLLGLSESRPNPAVYKNRFEYTLLREIRFLNDLGQERALEFISGLKELPKYTVKKAPKRCSDKK
jgi:transcriptional regulator with XRE-family HTH domain